MMITAAVLLALSGLSLELTSPQRAVMVCEPVKVVLRYRATVDVPQVVIEDSDFTMRSVSFRMDSGGGWVHYVERARTLAYEGPVECPLPKGEQVVVNYVLLDGAYAGDISNPTCPFPTPGEYRLKAVYDRPGVEAPIESNVLTLVVESPPTSEQAVWAVLQAEPSLRLGEGPLDRLTELVVEHPASRYLDWARTRMYSRRSSRLQNGYDPDTGESLWRLERPVREAVKALKHQETALALLEQEWGAFEEERLGRLATCTSIAPTPAFAQQARADLMRRFPESQTALAILDWEKGIEEARAFDRETEQTQPPSNDKTRPVLSVKAAPASLRPPDHEMRSVSVMVDVSDNVDPRPAVRLVSITCDDGCNPALDVGGAEPNTDDREFELRAERTGAGQGRTYTITYSATDACGNEARAVATVVVPVDEGKGKED